MSNNVDVIVLKFNPNTSFYFVTFFHMIKVKGSIGP